MSAPDPDRMVASVADAHGLAWTPSGTASRALGAGARDGAERAPRTRPLPPPPRRDGDRAHEPARRPHRRARATSSARARRSSSSAIGCSRTCSRSGRPDIACAIWSAGCAVGRGAVHAGHGRARAGPGRADLDPGHRCLPAAPGRRAARALHALGPAVHSGPLRRRLLPSAGGQLRAVAPAIRDAVDFRLLNLAAETWPSPRLGHPRLRPHPLPERPHLLHGPRRAVGGVAPARLARARRLALPGRGRSGVARAGRLRDGDDRGRPRHSVRRPVDGAGHLAAASVHGPAGHRFRGPSQGDGGAGTAAAAHPHARTRAASPRPRHPWPPRRWSRLPTPRRTARVSSGRRSARSSTPGGSSTPRRLSEAAIRAHPLSPDVHHAHAIVLDDAGRLDEAVDAARRAVCLDPMFAVAHLTLGSGLARRGHEREARRALSRAARLLGAMPPEAHPPGAEGETAAALLGLVRVHLARLTDRGRALTSAREDERSLLERRARVLARPHSAHAPARRLQARMRFQAGGEAFALDLEEVAAVARPLALTALPGATAPLVGVAVWRGRVISVLDVAGLHGGADRGGRRYRPHDRAGGRAAPPSWPTPPPRSPPCPTPSGLPPPGARPTSRPSFRTARRY